MTIGFSSGGPDMPSEQLEYINNVDAYVPRIREHSVRDFELGSIFRAPIPLKLANARSFDPLVVSIGPYNRHKQAELAIKDDDKIPFVYDIIPRGVIIDDLTTEVMEMVPRARNCYSDRFDEISDRDFAKMMVVDGCFIIRVLLFIRPKMPYYQTNVLPVMKGEKWLLPSIRLDLIKVENQIPFFILQTLRQSLLRRGLRSLPLVYDLALDFLHPLIAAAITTNRRSEDLCFHLLSVFHCMLLPNVPEYRIQVFNHLNARSKGHSIVRASSIWSRGILLKVSNNFPMDFAYHNGILEAPCFTIDQNTETILRNLLAYEQGNRLVVCRTTAFVTVMNALVDKPIDVAFLRRKGMVSHSLGSDEEAAALINSLNIGIPHNNFECFLCQLDVYTKPTFMRLVQSIMSISEFIIFAVLHPGSFFTWFLAVLALYVGITQTILTLFALK